MSFTIEHGCPQCGAALQLDETDHILLCPYCDVKSLLFSPDYFRYVLPDKTSDRSLIYVPYLRFKGIVYYCTNTALNHRVVDITQLGIKFNRLPVSLGVRPQAMKLKFVTPELNGSFLKFSMKAIDILTRAAKIPFSGPKKNIIHRAFIGETMSIIYLPVYLDGDRLYDGILKMPIASLPHGREDMEPLMMKNPGWEPRFISTLCPKCGWKMDGERESVALLCKNCNTAWEFLGGNWKRLNLSLIAGKEAESLYIPFWKITARVKGLDIDTFSDFIRLTNQPMIVGDERGKEDMNFFSPAFKLRPTFFLNLARQFTILQMDFMVEDDIAQKKMYPVTLPKTEAIQALKVILASTTVNRKKIFPNLPKISFEVKGITLVYMPFIEGPNDMIQEDSGIAINRPSLKFGRKM